MAGGVLAGVSFAVPPARGLVVALAVLAASALVVGLSSFGSPLGAPRGFPATGSLLLAAGGLTAIAMLGVVGGRNRFLLPSLRDAERASHLGEEKPVEVVGRIISPWTSTGSRHKTHIQPDRSLIDGRDAGFERPLALVVAGQSDPATAADLGDLVRVEGTVRLPDPGGSARSPFGLPPEPALTLKSAAQIERLGGPAGVLGPVLVAHRWVKSRLESYLSEDDRPALAFLMAILLGETADLPATTVSAFRDGGVAHVLSISGLHVALVAAFLGALVRRFGLTVAQRDALLIVLVGLFAVFAGARPPVLRSALMIGLYLLARLLGRPTSPAQVLGLSGLVLLLGRPEDLFDVGFLLTFAAVAGISAFGPTFTNGFSRIVPAGPVAQAFGATLGAELAVFPIQAFVFNVVPLISLLTNLVVVPVAGLFLTLSLVLLPFLLIGPTPAVVAFFPLAVLHDALLFVLRAFDRLHAVRVVPTPPFALVAFLGLLLGVGALFRSVRGAALAIAGLFVVGVLVAPGRRIPPGEALLQGIDVGQGDAWVLATHRGSLLVDGGGTPDAAYEFGRIRLLPKLCDLGLVSFDTVALTHSHPDHARGLLTVLGLFPVGELVLPAGAPRDVELDELLEVASRRGLPVRRAAFPEHLDTAGLDLAVLHPGVETYPRAKENNSSLVLAARVAGRRLLLTGDIEAIAERDLVARTSVVSDVLKVAHHGSRTSTTPELLSAVAPRIGLIGVGRRNRFGHPSPGVLNRLAGARVRVFRTDRDGDLALLFSGGRIFPLFANGAERLR